MGHRTQSIRENPLITPIQNASHREANYERSEIFKSHNAEAINELFSECMPMLLRTARRVLHSKEDTEDALQDGLLLAFRRAHQFEGRAKFSTWLHMVVLNAARTRLRREAVHRSTCSVADFATHGDDEICKEVFLDPGLNPEEQCALSERSEILDGMIAQLLPNQRSAVELCALEEMEGKEAAATLGITLPALKTRLHRASRALVEQAKRSGVHPVHAK
jgi:RNA polymerase sigma-70 factor, ECF subfamily